MVKKYNGLTKAQAAKLKEGGTKPVNERKYVKEILSLHETVSDFICSGTIEECIQHFNSKMENIQKIDSQYYSILLDCYLAGYEDPEIYFYGLRPETDEEMNLRISNHKKRSEAAKKAASNKKKAKKSRVEDELRRLKKSHPQEFAAVAKE